MLRRLGNAFAPRGTKSDGFMRVMPRKNAEFRKFLFHRFPDDGKKTCAANKQESIWGSFTFGSILGQSIADQVNGGTDERLDELVEKGSGNSDGFRSLPKHSGFFPRKKNFRFLSFPKKL